MAFIDDIKRTYSQGSMLMRFIFINIGVFVILRLIVLVALLAGSDSTGVLGWVEMPGNLWQLLHRPWTLITYMFAHYDLLHILFNMLWFYWLGRIFMEFFSPKQLTGLYLLGGLGGAVLYLLACNLLPHVPQRSLIGASASVIAVVVAVAAYNPDYKIGLLFIGEVSIKWVAIVTVVFALLSIDSGNPGTGIAHLGGALVGLWYALRIRRGRDITRPVNAVLDTVAGLFNGRSFKLPRFKREKRASGKRPASNNAQRQQPTSSSVPSDGVTEEELDAILGKIKAAGYDALTDEERDKLFKVSRRRTP